MGLWALTPFSIGSWRSTNGHIYVLCVLDVLPLGYSACAIYTRTVVRTHWMCVIHNLLTVKKASKMPCLRHPVFIWHTKSHHQFHKQTHLFIVLLCCAEMLCVCVCAVHKVRDYVCAAGQSRNVESLGADNKKKREKKTSKKETTTLLRTFKKSH